MTTAQLDHLRRIDAHLEHLLDIAAKRTPGEWGCVNSPLGGTGEQDERDEMFVEACAGNAEAGWRATRAAIALLLSMGEHRHDIETAKAGFDALESILAAFPNI